MSDPFVGQKVVQSAQKRQKTMFLKKKIDGTPSILGEPKGGGWSGAGVPCRTLSDPVRWVWLGPIGSFQGTLGSRMVPYGSVYQSYIDMGQSSDPGARRVPSGHIGFRQVSVRTLIWHDGTRRGSTGRSTVPIGVQLMYGPIRDPTASPRALRGLVGTQRTPGGPPAAPSDPA